MRFEADRQAFCATGVAPVLVEGAQPAAVVGGKVGKRGATVLAEADSSGDSHIIGDGPERFPVCDGATQRTKTIGCYRLLVRYR